MKNILITIITVLITVFVGVCMIRGFSIGNFKVLSFSQIAASSKQLDADIEKLNDLKNTTYKKKVSDLETSTKNLASSKQKYLDLASVSTEKEIKEATVTQKYAMEYLWSKLGGYATKEGVNAKIVVETSGVEEKNTINFTIEGSYIGIINYVSAIEDDSDLGFRIENFKITGNTDILTATFKVSNVGIKAETVTNKPTASSNTNVSANTQSTTDNTNNTNTVNQ